MEATPLEDGRAIPSKLLRETFTATLALGTVTFLSGAPLTYWGLMGMRDGSCSAALITLYGILPLAVLTALTFFAGAVAGRNDPPERRASRVSGLVLAVTAFPFWMLMAFKMVRVMEL